MSESELPSGTVTFLFTDIEGSTRLWEEHAEAMRDALTRHDELLRVAIEAHGGYVVKTTGDGFHAAFGTAEAGVVAAVAAQRALEGEAWPLPDRLRVRMGLHTGAASLRDGDYFGSSLNRAARLMGVAHGGQVVCSQATTDLARDVLGEGVDFVDLGEHRLRDLSRAERVFQVCVPGLVGQFATLTSVDAFPGNLPLQVSSFIGRDRELARVEKALADARVVTLTGVGGVGKTRLALQVAAEVLPGFREGAWLVELAAVRDPDGVVGACAAVFGVSARAGQTLEQSLVEFLRSKQLLLVLDNCEHLLESVADLVELLELSCAELSVLATSREGLALDGERVVPVPSLSAPADDANLDAAAGADAVRLFEERASAIDPDFALTQDNTAAVVQICRRLDGVPLAIELAAARVTTMNLAELARGLDRRFDILAGGRRRAVQRHQTLRAAIDWSYELCSEAEQRLLARLAVFAGGCTREAVEGVCAEEPLEVRAVFEVLAGLVAKSLVVAQRDEPETRYRLLETIREYGEERLAEHDETDALRTRHAHYYCEFVRVVGEVLLGPGQIDAARRLEPEHENLLAAMNHAIDTRDVDLALRLLRNMPGASQTGYELRPPVDAIHLPGATEHPLYPYAVALAAVFAAFRGDRAAAETFSDDALAAVERLHSDLGPRVDWMVSSIASNFALQTGALHDAATHMERSLEIARTAERSSLGTARTADWNWWIAFSLACAAMYHAMAGETAAAIPLADEGLTLARQIGQPSVIVYNLAAYAASLAEQDPQRARALLRESIDIRAVLGYEQTMEITQALLVAARIGDWTLSLELASRSIRGLHWLGDQPLCAGILNIAARAVTSSDPEAAAMIQGGARGLLDRLGGAVPAPDTSAGAPGGPTAPSGDASFVTELRRQTTGLLREALDENRLRDLRAEGQAMDFDHVVAYALDAIHAAQHDAES